MPVKHIFQKICACVLTAALALSSLSVCVSAEDYVSIFDSGIDFHCAGFYMENVDTGTPVISRNALEKRGIASVSKLMTVLLAAEAIERGDITLASEITAEYGDFNDMDPDGSTAGISKGETVTAEQLIYCMLVGSANEAANILARLVAGDIDSFVGRMNSRASELGCQYTSFLNPHGLTTKSKTFNVSCAYDVSLILKQIMKYDYVVAAMSTSTYKLTTNKHKDHLITSGNYLLDETRSPIRDGKSYRYEFIKGAKTGYTSAAGACFASFAEKDGITYVCVALGGERESKYTTNYAQWNTKEAYQWAFDSLSVRPIVDPALKVDEIPVSLSFDSDTVKLVPEKEITALIPNDFDISLFQKEYRLPESLTAPVTKGQVVCDMNVLFDGKVIGTVNLVTDRDIERSATLGAVDKFETIVKSKLFIVVICILVCLLIAYGVMLIFINARRRRSKKRNSQSYRRGISKRGRRFK